MINVEITIGGVEYTLTKNEATKLLTDLKKQLGDHSLSPVEYPYMVRKWEPLVPTWTTNSPMFPGTITC